MASASPALQGHASEPTGAVVSIDRAILTQGWGRFLTRLEQKAGDSGVGVNPASTSQTCRACGHVAQESRESRAVFSCVACGHEDPADHGHHCRSDHPGPGTPCPRAHPRAGGKPRSFAKSPGDPE